jgi:hypothetical protein
MAHIESRYILNGSPRCCAFEPCGKDFTDKAYHAGDGRYYCDEFCAEEAARHGLRRIENLARSVH